MWREFLRFANSGAVDGRSLCDPLGLVSIGGPVGASALGAVVGAGVTYA